MTPPKKGRVTYPPCGDTHSYGPWRRAKAADERAFAEANVDLLRELTDGHPDAFWWHALQLAHVEATGRFPLYVRRCANPKCPQDGADQCSPQHPDHPDHPHKNLVRGTVAEGLDAWLSP